MTTYKLSALTARELDDLYETLDHLDGLLLMLRERGVANRFDLERLAIAAGNELVKRAMEDTEFICEQAVRDGLLTKIELNGETYYMPTGNNLESPQ